MKSMVLQYPTDSDVMAFFDAGEPASGAQFCPACVHVPFSMK